MWSRHDDGWAVAVLMAAAVPHLRALWQQAALLLLVSWLRAVVYKGVCRSLGHSSVGSIG